MEGSNNIINYGDSVSPHLLQQQQTLPRCGTSPGFLFRPIPEPTVIAGEMTSQGASGTRMRFNSGGTVAVASPKPPKLFTCYRSNQEAWSSNGSRHSSRPGSSASSRPPSQCAGATPASVNTTTLYSKSTNSSLSDVSVARNFQNLSVSTRRAAFKTQKWSHSFDQGGATQPGVTLTCSNSTSAAYPTSGSSPGKRRQSSLQQKSLDLDSGYGGNSSFDLKSQSSWGNYGGVSSALNDPNHLSVCSPISDAQLELQQLIKQESKEKKCLRLAPTSSQEDEEEDEDGEGEEEEEGDEEDEKEDLLRCNSLPSFPESFNVGNAAVASSSAAADAVTVVPPVVVDDENLDEEIKMIVAQGTGRQLDQTYVDEDVLSFLNKHYAEIKAEDIKRPEPQKHPGSGNYSKSRLVRSKTLPERLADEGRSHDADGVDVKVEVAGKKCPFCTFFVRRSLE